MFYRVSPKSLMVTAVVVYSKTKVTEMASLVFSYK